MQGNPVHAPEERLYKVIVVGEAQAGKTCLIRKYVHNIFHPNTLQLWDIAGQERYGQLTRVYYQGAVGAFVVYDVTRGDTFEAAAKWKQDIDNKVFLPDGNKIPCILLANKCDLEADPKRSEQEMDEFCKKFGFVGWFETSSKTNHNVERAFHQLVENVLTADGEAAPEYTKQKDNTVVIDGRRRNQNGTKPKKQCC